MGNVRVFWLAWCCGWALFWLLCGFLFLPCWLLVPVSLCALLLPVGAPSGQAGAPPVMPAQRAMRYTEQDDKLYWRDRGAGR
jgi:hypothetical protein